MTLEIALKTLFPQAYQAWLALFVATGLHFPAEIKDLSAFCDELNTTLQQKWLRDPRKERWELNDEQISEEQKKTIKTAFESMGLYQAKEPTEKQYDCAFLMGALEPRVRLRFQSLLDQWQKGIRFKRIYVLAGYRKLTVDKEPITKALEKKKIDLNETNMMEYVINEMFSNQNIIKKGEVEIIFVNAPTQQNMPRAITTDNFTSWQEIYGLEKTQENKKIIVFSNAPYISYQGLVALRVLSDKFKNSFEISGSQNNHFILQNGYDIEAVGPSGEIDVLTVGLDTLAREVYESLPILKMRAKERFNDKLEDLEQKLTTKSTSSLSARAILEDTSKVVLNQYSPVQNTPIITGQTAALESPNKP